MRIVTPKVMAKRGRTGQQAAKRREEVATGGKDGRGRSWGWLRGARPTERGAGGGDGARLTERGAGGGAARDKLRGAGGGNGARLTEKDWE